MSHPQPYPRARLSLLASAASLSICLSATPAMAQASASDPTQPSAAAPATAESTNAAPGAGELQDIVVTARRVSESVQRIPVSVGVLAAQDLASRQIQSITDLKGAVAGLTTSRSQSAANSFITIRGVSSANLVTVATDSAVGFYIDGVYIARTSGQGGVIPDIARVEVLRGPQGTLFGRNSSAGAINFVTALPTDKFSLEGAVLAGNYDRVRAEGTVNLPITSTLAARVSYTHDEQNGDVRNLYRTPGLIFGGPVDYGSFKRARTFGASNADAVSAKLRFTGIDGLTVDYKFDYSTLRETPIAAQIIGFAPSAAYLVAGGANSIYATSIAANPNAIRQSLSRLPAISADTAAFSNVRLTGHLLTLEYKLDDHLTLKNIAAYRTTRTGSKADLDGGVYLQPTAAGPVPFCASCASCAFNALRQHQFSEEAQAIGNWGSLNAIVGAFYFRERGKLDNTYSNGAAIPFAPAVFTPTPAAYVFGTQDTAINRSTAVYGHVDFTPVDRLKIALGGRYTMDRRSEDDRRVGGVGLAKVSFDRFNWDASLDYQVADSVMLYGRYATGYLSGGILRGVPYRPQDTRQYEAGFKSDLLDRHLRLNVAAFYTRTKNLQSALPNFGDATSTAILQAATGLPGPFAIGTLQYNIQGITEVRGFEVEATLLPVTGVTLNANLGYNDPKYPDRRLNSAPKTTFSFSANYDAPRFSNGSFMYLRFDGDYRSRYFGTGFTSPAPLTGDVPALLRPGYATSADYLGAVRRALIQGDYWLVNGRLALTELPVGGGKLEVAGYVRNIFNDNSPLYTVNYGTIYAGGFERPRTYGVELKFRY